MDLEELKEQYTDKCAESKRAAIKCTDVLKNDALATLEAQLTKLKEEGNNVSMSNKRARSEGLVMDDSVKEVG